MNQFWARQCPCNFSKTNQAFSQENLNRKLAWKFTHFRFKFLNEIDTYMMADHDIWIWRAKLTQFRFQFMAQKIYSLPVSDFFRENVSCLYKRYLQFGFCGTLVGLGSEWKWCGRIWRAKLTQFRFQFMARKIY